MLLPFGGSYNMPTNTDAIIAPKQRLVVPNFIEGWIDAFDINMIPANGLYKAVNVVFDTLGSAETRKGLDPVLVTVPANTRMRSLDWYEVAGSSPKLVCAYDDKIAYVETSDWSTTDIITGLINTTGQIDMFSYSDKLYVLSNDDPMKVYNGSTNWSAGLTAPVGALTAAIRITAPEDALTAVAGAGTGLTGTYKYAVTFVTASGESGIGPESSQVTVSNKDMSLSNIPIGPTGVTSRKIYRTKANGILYYLVTTIADNTTKVYTDSTADTSLGVEPPDSSLLNGEYIYRVSFVYGARGESSAGPASTGVTVVYGQISLSAIPTGGAGCTQRKIYRTEGNANDETQRLLTTIDDNTTTTFTDTIEDADLTDMVVVDSNIPPNFSFGIFKKKSSTLWAVDTTNKPNRVYICKALYPEVCEADSYIDLPNNDQIVALVEYFDNIYALCKHKIFKITGENIDTVAISVISHFSGCTSHKTLFHVRQDVVFLSFEGLFTLSRVLLSSNAETVDIKPLSEKVSKTFDNINWQYAYRACAISFENLYVISFPTGTATQNSATVMYNLDGKNWCEQSGAFGQIASYTVGDISNDNTYKIFCGTASQTGKIYKWPGAEYNDDGQAIDSYIISGVLHSDFPEAQKRWTEFYVEIAMLGDWNMYVWYRKKLYSDITLGWVERLISLDPGYSVSGGEMLDFTPPKSFPAALGVETSDTTVLVDVKGKRMTARSKYLQFKIGNNAQYNTYFKIYKLMVYFRVKKPRVS